MQTPAARGRSPFTLLPLLTAALLALSSASAARSAAPALVPDEALRRLVAQAIAQAVNRTSNSTQPLRTNEVAVSLIRLDDTNRLASAAYRGDVAIYPASVIKLFYLAAAHRWLEDRRLADTSELQRALRDMIVDSSNEATHYVIDLLTGTTSGPELSETELAEWFGKRNAVSRYFASLGYRQVVANKKPWCEGPYGRESQSIRTQKPSRNQLTTDETARLLLEIVLGQCVTPARSAAMLELMRRDPSKPLEDGGEPSQDNAFLGLAVRDLPKARLWSKAGLTSQVRHDAAYVELPSGTRFILVVFTENHAADRRILQAIGQTIMRGLP